MTTTETENAAPELSTPQIVGKIETDVFCSACHYNLHSLDVIRDQRLDMAIVRCPECGKFHPAGMATGAGRVWLSRLATLLIALWVSFLGLFVLGIGFGFFITDAVSVEGFLTIRQDPLPMAGRWNYQRIPMVARDSTMAWEMFWMNSLLYTATGLLGLILGTGGAVFVSHVKRIWLLVLLLVPLAAVAIVSMIFYSESGRYAPETPMWIAGRMVTQVLLQWGGIALGILLGRAVTRGVLSVVLTRRLLQHLRFLWTVDNKVPPGVI